MGEWFRDATRFVANSYPWFLRGGYANGSQNHGVFSFYNASGSGNYNISFRIVLTEIDN